MPYLIFTIYNTNTGENYLPRVYRIPKSIINNLHNDFKYQQIREKLKINLMKDYNEDTEIEEIFMIDEFILEKIPLYGKRE